MRSNIHSRDFSDRNLGDAVINHILTASATLTACSCSATWPRTGPAPLASAFNVEVKLLPDHAHRELFQVCLIGLGFSGPR